MKVNEPRHSIVFVTMNESGARPLIDTLRQEEFAVEVRNGNHEALDGGICAVPNCWFLTEAGSAWKSCQPFLVSGRCIPGR